MVQVRCNWSYLMDLSAITGGQAFVGPESEKAMRSAAQELEATFLAEMLKSAGMASPRESFGGGIGEEQFSSFLLQEESRAMVKAGGIGLAESIFKAMKDATESHHAKE
jgi:Rod binding domain-containing protein